VTSDIDRSSQRPYVVAHLAVSLDGATTGFEPDVAKFYALAATWREDVTLAGADTILAQEKALDTAPRPGPVRDGPLLAVVDGKGRVRQWDALRDAGHWSDVLALHARHTPPRAKDRAVAEWVLGAERVDLAAALDELGRCRGARTVRVDSGGSLVGALLEAGLLDEGQSPCSPLPRRRYGRRAALAWTRVGALRDRHARPAGERDARRRARMAAVPRGRAVFSRRVRPRGPREGTAVPGSPAASSLLAGLRLTLVVSSTRGIKWQKVMKAAPSASRRPP